MKYRLLDWIRAHTNWIILAILAVGFFVAVIATSVILPLILIGAALALAIIRHWQAIKTFDFFAFDEWLQGRLDSIGVQEWHAPYRAADVYCTPTVVKSRNEAAAQMNSIMMELIRGQEKSVDASPNAAHRDGPVARPLATSHASYEAAQVRLNQCNISLARELVALLARGELISKGLLVQNDVAQPERAIPASRWRILNLDISKAEASGRGLIYTGVVIGKKPVAKKIPKPLPHSGPRQNERRPPPPRF